MIDKIEILKRHKNKNGDVEYYTVKINNKQTTLNANTLITLHNNVINAILTKTGDFRAKPGCNIETLVDVSNLKVRRTSSNKNKLAVINKTDIVTNNCINKIDYYGKNFINACRKIRRYARLGKITVSGSKHKANNGLNTHLFKLIDACGISYKEFIKGYLSEIQPYSLELFESKKHPISEGHIWLSDIGYNIKLVIKLDESDKNHPVVVSFHESNRNGESSQSRKNFTDKPCAVFIDNCSKIDNDYYVEYCIQRGFIRFDTISSITRYINKDIALIDYRDIKNKVDTVVNDIYHKLIKVYTEVNSKDVVSISNIEHERLSFISLGRTTVNNIYMLIDLFTQFTDRNSRSLITEVTRSIIEELPDFKKKEIYEALIERFSHSKNNELIDFTLNELK